MAKYEDGNKKEEEPDAKIWRFLTIFFMLGIVVLALVLGVVLTAKNDKIRDLEAENEELRSHVEGWRGPCEESAFQDEFVLEWSESNPHPLHALYLSEIERVQDFLVEEGFQLYGADMDEDFIYAIELEPPNKEEVLEHLYGNVPKPARHALAIIICGSTHEIKEYIVKRLDYGTLTLELKRTLPFGYRPIVGAEYDLWEEVIEEAMEELSDQLEESYGHNYDSGYITWTDSAPRGLTQDVMQTWIWFMFYVDGKYALPLGLEMHLDHTDLDDIHIVEVVYNRHSYDSVQDLIDDWDNIDHIDFKIPEHSPEDPLFSSLYPRGQFRAGDDVPAARNKPIGGNTFRVHENIVSYKGWQFLISNTFKSGITFHDIKFLDNRIAYELSLQEATAFYSGSVYQPIQSTSNYQDSGWGMGWNTNELIVGIDCPEDALYLDLFTLADCEEPRYHKKSVCIFEEDAAFPLMRHYDNSENIDGIEFAAGTRASRLVVRSSVTVYNYDYIYDYIFHLDGTLEAKMTATGYLQAAYYKGPEDDEFGYRVGEHTLGSLHDHFLNYKLDMDVLGTENTLYLHSISVVEELNHPYMPKQKHISKTQVEEELDALFRYNPEAPKYFAFGNDEQKNSWDQVRTYSLRLNTFANNLINDENDFPFLNGMEWIKHNLVVTQHKNNEQRSSEAIYDMQAPEVPTMRFSDYYDDNDDLLQEDLVAWITVGHMHIPHSEDVPVTVTSGASIGFVFSPFNFFDVSAGVNIRQNIFVRQDQEDESITVEENNLGESDCYVPVDDFTFYGHKVFVEEEEEEEDEEDDD